MAINKYYVQVLAVEAAAILLAGSIAFVIMWARTLSESSRAQAFLTDVTKLEVGKSTFEDAKVVARKDGGIPWWVSDNSMQCTYEICAFRFLFENKPLTSTHLVPYVGLIGTVLVEKGVVTERQINYFRYSKRPFAYNVREMVLPEGDSPQAKGMRRLIGFRRINVDNAGIPSAVSVGLSPSISSDKRTRAYALDVSCLSKLFGCGDPSAFFPHNIPYQGPPLQTDTQTW
jgi:hypothetical protein